MPTKRYRAQSRGRRVVSRARPNARPIFDFIPSDSSNSNAEDSVEQPLRSKDRQNPPARRKSRSILKPRGSGKKHKSISRPRRSTSRYSNSRSGNSQTNSIELSAIDSRQKSNQLSTSKKRYDGYIVTVDLLVNGRPVKGEIAVKLPVEKLPPSVQLVGLKIDRE